MPITKINSINLYYESYGEGQNLILIGGLTTNNSIWSLMAADLAKYFNVITFDNRGAGQSSQPKHGYSVDVMADDVAQLMEFCEIESAFVVGSSMGASIAQKLCINYPNKVKAAILAGAFAKLPKTAEIQIESIIKFIDAGISQDLILETVIPWIFGNSFLENPSNIEAEIKRIKNDPHPQTYDGYVGQVESLKSYNALDQLENIKCSTLVLAGREDLLIPVKYSQMIVDKISKARLEIIPDCGHMFYREQPKVFTEHIVSFFHNTI